MRKILLFLLLFLSLVSCDNVLTDLGTLDTETDVIDPYVVGDSYSLVFSQYVNRSLHIKIHDGERLLSERLIGEFSDPAATSNELQGTIILPAEIKTYTISDVYSGQSTTVTVDVTKGSFIYIVCSTSSIFAYQEKIYKSTAKR